MQTFDDTLPEPRDVERVFNEYAGGDGLIDYSLVWNPDEGLYEFKAYSGEHMGPKRKAIAVPIYEDSKFVDLLVIHNDTSFGMVTRRTSWLGRENITGTVRLHRHPLDWLEADCTGCCHVAPISRQTLKELRGSESIVCNDIATALEAWSWGFDAEDADLSRFEIDDEPDAINAYYVDEVRWHAARVMLDMERTRG